MFVSTPFVDSELGSASVCSCSVEHGRSGDGSSESGNAGFLK